MPDNRLAQETSPYLLQHAHNPVDWYPWGEEALREAERREVPILLSVGYAACHWCHVMERESFENEAIAALMNEHFVCIKVDREERPDIDEIYMQATVALTGQGGWPMTVFMTPDTQQPFFAGTYFPPDRRQGMPGFDSLLRRIAELWRHERKALLGQAAEVTEQLRRRVEVRLTGDVGESSVDAAVAQLGRAFDTTYGGFGSAPKFPPSAPLELLMRHHRREGDQKSWTMVRRTLDGMAAGGMRDHLGGGFARYSTDERWLVPHFEKMLYDNAQLARVYAHAYQFEGEAEDARVVRELCDYVLREMTSPEGAFYSATDADSEGVEGKFFVWRPGEIEAILPPDQARAFCAFYDVTEPGNWEGVSVLHTPRAREDVAAALGLAGVAALEALLEPARAKMLAARGERVAPLTDDKVLTAWNGLMVGALAECGRIFDEPRWREAAARAARFLCAEMRRPDGGLFRTTRAGKTHLDAYLEDYAYLCDALVDVYEAGQGVAFLTWAEELADRMIADFAADDGAFCATAHDHESLLLRMREGQDGAVPNPNAVAARALTRLSWHLGRDELRERAERAVGAHGQVIARAPRAFASSLAVVDMLLEGPTEIVLAGSSPEALAAEVGRHYLPNRVIVWAEGARAPEALVAGKGPIDGKSALYVCREFTCRRPVTEPLEVAAVLAEHHDTAVGGRERRLGQRLAGSASSEGTSRYAEAHPLGPAAFAELGALRVAAIGFGGYRVDDETPLHAQALERALRGGCNLIDTSTHYGDGGSERMIGQTLKRLVEAEDLRRDEVVVVTKAGYVQGRNLELAQRREKEGRPFREMVKYQSACWHCIHPDFLADQLERSLERLGIDTVDVLLLHNPEYYFSDAKTRGEVTDEVRDTFYERVARAFAFCEAMVAEGKLRAYGVSSNTLPQPPSEPEATNLERFWEAALEAGGADHHFRVVQLPLNLLESSAVLDPEPGQTAVDRAQRRGLAVLVNRPLNAITEAGLSRLAEPPEVEGPEASFVTLLERVSALEAELLEAMRGLSLSTPDGTEVGLGELFRWGQELRRLDGRLDALDAYDQIAREQIGPQVGQVLRAVTRAVPTSIRERWTGWRDRYVEAMETALAALKVQVAKRAETEAERLAAPLTEALPLARAAEPLARKALWTSVSTPGVTVTLLGMRRPRYVDDALAVLSWSPMSDVETVYRAYR